MNSNKYINAMRKVATIEHLVDGVMVVFALASIGNISEYMKGHGHNPVTAYGVGIALGLGLVAISIMLARTPTDDRRTFGSMLAATLAVGLLSGTVQALAYYEHTANIWTACLQGYGFPLIGECLLAVAMAMHTASERKRRARLADDGMEERINDAISEALANIDISGMQAHIEKQAAVILKHKMAEIVARRVGQSTANPLSRTGDDAHQITTNGEDSTPTFGPQNLPAANDVRRQLVEERRAAIVQLCESYGAMGAPDLVKRLRDDRGIIASTQTVRDDCNALVDDGQLVAVGRKWDAPRTISAALPTAPAPVLNGNGQH
uniref:Uncharacterized protein n=1 Tax=uncultured bacterium A1Q1_fos_2004 TaxID=1256557 RepID=L7VZ70_9BACT|nr:hypothetical protein [uncultured bacterium A1Q1_fos_2004]